MRLLFLLLTPAVAKPFWYESIHHNGLNPTLPLGQNWTVFRNVKDYGAKGDGLNDDTAAIQLAISSGNQLSTRETGHFGSTGQPAVVYFPSGTYLVHATIRSAIGTVLIGNPTDRPVIKAATNFTGTYLLFGRDRQLAGLVGFYHGIKHLVLDSTEVAANRSLTLLEWNVSQANQLSNVLFRMPRAYGDAGHTGVFTGGMCSGLIMNDLVFEGGGTGIALAATQYHMKSMVFKGVKTGIRLVSLVQGTGQGLVFDNCDVGIDATAPGLGMFSLIDSQATNTSSLLTTFAKTNSSATHTGSLVLENIQVDNTSTTVSIANSPVLVGSIPPGESWIRGNTYLQRQKQIFAGQKQKSSRPSALINATTYAYPTVPPPTYAEFDITQVVNIKDVASHPVKGDGITDDTANIQAILLSEANGTTEGVFYFPHGIYLLSDTLYIPPGTRMVGEALTQLSAFGEKFMDATRPRVMLQVGKPGDMGVAQMSDFMFTVADILPGAVLVQVNMRGHRVGDVGMWNCHYRIGGARGSRTYSQACVNPATCLAARLTLHLTASSSAYIENTWSWTADHDLDGPGGNTYPGTGAGFLIEAQHGTWLLGAGVEHHVLYQVNIRNAKNIFIGLQQGESAYWQGDGNPLSLQAPAPWTQFLSPSSDPDFKWCAVDSAQCRMGLYQIVQNSSDINIYSAGFWNFVAGPNRTFCTSDCQENAVLYGDDNERLSVYGLTTLNVKNLILERRSGIGGREGNGTGKRGDVYVVASREANSGASVGGFGAASIAAYLV